MDSFNRVFDLKEAKGETTELILFVQTSDETIRKWNREMIVKALIKEAGLSKKKAEEIGKEVEDIIKKSEIKTITSPLIREIVNARLIEHGLEKARKEHTRLGLPLYDVHQMLTMPNKENANVPHGPEATNLTLAEAIKKEYALLKVFSEDISKAHLNGDIHIHDLGFIDRPYCSGQNIEYLKLFGLNLPNALSIASPAKHPEVLLAHMLKFSAALQCHFAGAIGWDAINIFFAPYLTRMSDRDLEQFAQMLIYEFSQQAVARGGQAIFSDLNIYWEVPDHFKDVKAIGPGGKYTGKTYEDYIKEAQRFAKAIFKVYMEGDASGRPFFFPKPLVHITDHFFQTEGHEEFLQLISEVASLRGNTYFVFDRGGTAKISECCRLSFKLSDEDLKEAKEPWRMRYSALQNVTINLPRLAFRSKRDPNRLSMFLFEAMENAVHVHLQKRAFIEKLLKRGKNGPLSLLSMELDGEPYLRLNRVTHLIGMVGLNELVKFMTGKELHASDETIKYGLDIIAQMRILCDKLGQRHGLKLVLEQTPAESTAHRLAMLDIEHFFKEAKEVIKGNMGEGEIYYTNSTLFNVGAPINPIERVKYEGLFHPLIEGGAISHIWLGEKRPPASSIANFVKKTFLATQNDQIAFSPEFTTCKNCMRTERGLIDNCPYCHSSDIEHITRITGYFTKVSSWNKGKIGELKDRFRNNNYFS